MLKNCGNLEYTTKMPFEGIAENQLLKSLDEHLQLGTYDFRDGRVSGAVYTCNPKLVELIKEVYGKASYTNPLHSDLFPGICKMEAEVIRMVCNLFHGSPESCGSVRKFYNLILNLTLNSLFFFLFIYIDDYWWY